MSSDSRTDDSSTSNSPTDDIRADDIRADDIRHSGAQATLGLRAQEETGRELKTVFLRYGDWEALLRHAAGTRDYRRPSWLLRDHLHLSLINRIGEGAYFPRRLLMAVGRPRDVGQPGASAGTSGLLGERESRRVGLQVSIRGWPRVVRAAKVVNGDLGRLEARVARSGSLFRWPFYRCTPQVLVRAAVREIAASVRKGTPRLFSRGKGACAREARPHEETNPQAAASEEALEGAISRGAATGKTAFQRNASLEDKLPLEDKPPFEDKPEDDRPESKSTSSEKSLGPGRSPTGLQTALSCHWGCGAGLPTGHVRVSVPLATRTARRLQERAKDEEWGPGRLVRRGIDWIVGLTGEDPGRALRWIREAIRLQGRGDKAGDDQLDGDFHPENGSRTEDGFFEPETGHALELRPTRATGLKEAARLVAGAADSAAGGADPEDATREGAACGDATREGAACGPVGDANCADQDLPVTRTDPGLEDLTRAAALWAAGRLGDPGTGDPSTGDPSTGDSATGAPNAPDASIPDPSTGETSGVGRSAATAPPSKASGDQIIGSRDAGNRGIGGGDVGGQGGRMPGPRLFEKPGGQDRTGHQIRMAITREAKSRLERKAARYFRTATEFARLAVREMIRWIEKSPAEAFGYIQEESDLYRPPGAGGSGDSSGDSEYFFQFYIGTETKIYVRQARKALQLGPGKGLGRRVTRKEILQAAARLGIESMEISAPLAE